MVKDAQEARELATAAGRGQVAGDAPQGGVAELGRGVGDVEDGAAALERIHHGAGF